MSEVSWQALTGDLRSAPHRHNCSHLCNLASIVQRPSLKRKKLIKIDFYHLFNFFSSEFFLYKNALFTINSMSFSEYFHPSVRSPFEFRSHRLSHEHFPLAARCVIACLSPWYGPPSTVWHDETPSTTTGHVLDTCFLAPWPRNHVLWVGGGFGGGGDTYTATRMLCWVVQGAF